MEEGCCPEATDPPLQEKDMCTDPRVSTGPTSFSEAVAGTQQRGGVLVLSRQVVHKGPHRQTKVAGGHFRQREEF